MFGWKDRDINSMYRMLRVIMCLLLAPISVILFVAIYLSFPKFTLPLIPWSNFPVPSWFIIFFYTFGLRIVSLSAPYVNLATFSIITPFAVSLVTVFLVSGLLFTIFLWDLVFVAPLRTVKEYGNYRDVQRLRISLSKEGTTKEKTMIALNPVLTVVLFSLSTLWILNMLLLYVERITFIFVWIMILYSLLYAYYSFRLRKLITKYAQKMS